MDISIIICTYNPEERILSRCLKAIQNMDILDYSVELIIVDNNSYIPVDQQAYIADFVKRLPFETRIITETIQGLSFARVRGFKTAQSPIVIMFDDDNEPAKDYLLNAVKIMASQKEAGIVGPGIVIIDYLDDTPRWIKEKLGGYFQEKAIDEPGYTTQKTMWDTYYPPGTGQVIRRQVINEYMTYFESGRISATDRKGKNLSSAGDSQLIWSSLNTGLKVGQDPSLKLTHLIPGKRSTRKYLIELSYAVSKSGKLALVEMYPEMSSHLITYKWYKFIFHQFKVVYDGVRSSDVRTIPVKLAFLNGDYDSSFKAKKIRSPWLHRLVVKFLLSLKIIIIVTEFVKSVRPNLWGNIL